MDLHVSTHVATVPETLLTDGAAERFLPRVESHVTDGVSLLREPLAADGAAKRFLPCVDPHVGVQVRSASEPLATLGAAERPPHGVAAQIRGFASFQRWRICGRPVVVTDVGLRGVVGLVHS